MVGIDFAHLDAVWVWSPTKACTTCKIVKPLEDFALRSSSRDGRQPTCSICQRIKIKAHYNANTDYYLAKAAIRNAECLERNRAWLIDYLLAHPCVDCGEADLRVLTFDHVRGVKIANVGDMARMAIALKHIVAEVAKCDVRCHNCHTKKTARDFGWWSHRHFEALNN